MTYQSLLMLILTGGGLVPIVGYILNVIEEDVRPLNKGEKRAIAFALNVLIGFSAYVLAVYGGFWDNPLLAPNVVNAIGSDLMLVIGANFTFNQLTLSGARSNFFQKAIGSANRYVPKKAVKDNAYKMP